MIATLVSLVAIHACDQSGGNASLPPAKGTGTRTGVGATAGAGLTDVTYESWVKDYLTKFCTKCHEHKAKEQYDLSSYSAAKVLAQLSLETMKSGDMPKGGPRASKEQLEKMQAWIKGGTLEKKAASGASQAARPGLGNNTGARTGSQTSPTTGRPSSNPPASSALTWDKDILPIFRNSCGLASTGCHSSQARFGDLTTLQAAKRYVTGIRNRVNSGDMPRGRSLSDSDKQKIITWTNQGAN